MNMKHGRDFTARSARTLKLEERTIQRLDDLSSIFHLEGFKGVSRGRLLDILAQSEDAERILRVYLVNHGKKKAVASLRREDGGQTATTTVSCK